MKDLVYRALDFVLFYLVSNSDYNLANKLLKNFRSIESHALIEGTYKLAQFHFHWGGSNENEGGSEHTVDGKRFFSELHLVHYNTKYTNLTASLSHSDGLAVLGFFLDDR